MHDILLIGAGFTRNWGGPLSEEITGSLLGELQDDPQLVAALRRGPFEDAFQGFQPAIGSSESATRLQRLQDAVTGLFGRLNRTFLNMEFEFNNDVNFSLKAFLARFDAIFSLNQDLLLEIQYVPTFIQQGKWTGVVIPGMQQQADPAHTGPIDLTMVTWRPATNIRSGPSFQPLMKLHGSSNWRTESGEPILIMGSAKSGAIDRFPTLRDYHAQFSSMLNRPNTRLMVIGYSFQDDHINSVIEHASQHHGLGTYLVDPRGREVLLDPKMARAAIRVARDIENIRLVGELRRPLSNVFSRDAFAYGELMRFFETDREWLC